MKRDAMIENAIKNPDLFQIQEDGSTQTSFGLNQEWYHKSWQRAAGCGPTTAASLIYYLERKSPACRQTCLENTKSAALKQMEELWDFVTPSAHGVNTTKTLYNGAVKYAAAKGLPIEYAFLDVPKRKASRPAFSDVLSFLDRALGQDLPIAFLNLHNGSEKRLYSWHWVTLIGLRHSPDGTSATAVILDEGKSVEIDLALWYSTTNLGGGFVSLRLLS